MPHKTAYGERASEVKMISKKNADKSKISREYEYDRERELG
jgi:hypothetical protein